MWQLCRQSYLWFEGGVPTAGCTIILKSLGDRDSLARLKKTLDLLVFAAYHLRLETFLMDDQEMPIQEDSMDTASLSSSPPTTSPSPSETSPAPLIKAERPYRETILSLSPSVHFPLPYLLLLVRRDVERLDRLRELFPSPPPPPASKGSGDSGDSESHASPACPSSLVTSKYQSSTIRLDGIYSAYLQNYRKHVRAAEAWLSSLPFPVPSPLDHQNIIVLSWRVCTVSGTPCASPTLLSIEYYRRAGGDITLGYFLERLFMGAETICPERRCGRPQRLHTLTYAHGKVRVDVRVDPGLPGGVSGIADRLLVWGECSSCNRIGPVRPLSEASFAYSWGKYLELAFYGLPPSRSLCVCGAGSFASIRAFGLRGLIVRIRRGPLQLKEVSSPSPILLPKEDMKIIEAKEMHTEDGDEGEINGSSEESTPVERSTEYSDDSNDDTKKQKEEKGDLAVEDEREVLFHRAERLFTSIEQRLDQLGELEHHVVTPRTSPFDPKLEGKKEVSEVDLAEEKEEGRRRKEKDMGEEKENGMKENDGGMLDEKAQEGKSEVEKEEETAKREEKQVGRGELDEEGLREEIGKRGDSEPSTGPNDGKDMMQGHSMKEADKDLSIIAKDDGVEMTNNTEDLDQGRGMKDNSGLVKKEREEHLESRKDEIQCEGDKGKGKEGQQEGQTPLHRAELDELENQEVLEEKSPKIRDKEELEELSSPLSWRKQLEKDRGWFHQALRKLPLKPSPLDCVPLWLGLQDRAIRWEGRTEGAIQEWVALRTPPAAGSVPGVGAAGLQIRRIFREKTSMVMGGDKEVKEKGKEGRGEEKGEKEKDELKRENGKDKKGDEEEGKEKGVEKAGETKNKSDNESEEERKEEEGRGKGEMNFEQEDGLTRKKKFPTDASRDEGILDLGRKASNTEEMADDDTYNAAHATHPVLPYGTSRGLRKGKAPKAAPPLSHSTSGSTSEEERSRERRRQGTRRERLGKGQGNGSNRPEDGEAFDGMGKAPSYMKPTYSSQRLRTNGGLGILPPTSAPPGRYGYGERKGRRHVESNPGPPAWRNIHRSRSRSIAQVYRSSRDAAKVESDEEEFEGSMSRPRRRHDGLDRLGKERGKSRKDDEGYRLTRSPPLPERKDNGSRRGLTSDSEEDDSLSYGIEEMMQQYDDKSNISGGAMEDDVDAEETDGDVDEQGKVSRRSGGFDLEGQGRGIEGLVSPRSHQRLPRSQRLLGALQEVAGDDTEGGQGKKVERGRVLTGEERERGKRTSRKKGMEREEEEEEEGSDVMIPEEETTRGKSSRKEEDRRQLGRKMGGLTLGPGFSGAMDFAGPRRAVSVGTPTAEGAHPDRLSLVKTITNLWATGDPSVESIQPLQYPLEPSEHIFHKFSVMVRENEPSSIIAFSLR